MSLIFEMASIGDVEDLLGLYVASYGKDYPLEIGTNQIVMERAIRDPETCKWMVCKDPENSHKLVGSGLVEIDPNFRIGKVTGVTVHKDYLSRGIAKELIEYLVNMTLESDIVHTLYATARTVSIGSQKMLLKNSFVPLGIFPNARKIKSYETLVLFGLFSKKSQLRRQIPDKVPYELKRMYEIVQDKLGSNLTLPEYQEHEYLEGADGESTIEDDFEFIFAPKFANRLFKDMFKNDKESFFYPFHDCNLIISNSKLEIDIFASFNKKDHYCVLMSASDSIRKLGSGMSKLMYAVKEYGIYYVETLVRADYFHVISYLIENKFLPSALYPSMREEDGEFRDYVLLTRTMVPLDLSEMNIDESFYPYLKEYLHQWMRIHLKSYQKLQEQDYGATSTEQTGAWPHQ